MATLNSLVHFSRNFLRFLCLFLLKSALPTPFNNMSQSPFCIRTCRSSMSYTYNREQAKVKDIFELFMTLKAWGQAKVALLPAVTLGTWHGMNLVMCWSVWASQKWREGESGHPNIISNRRHKRHSWSQTDGKCQTLWGSRKAVLRT